MFNDELHYQILVLKCQRQDNSAFKEMVNLWEPRLYYYLRRLVGNESFICDILQETWIAVFSNINKLKNVRKFPAWLYRIAHCKAIEWLRAENKYVLMSDEQIVKYCENNITITFVNEQVELVHELLEKLNLVYREVLTLYFLEDFSINEMAEIIGIPEGTVKSRLHYAKNALREMLGGIK